jgi:hypothetical protein
MGILFDQFESMVKNLFNQVQVLYISTDNDVAYMDANRWERLILSHMPYLRIFDIAIRYSSTNEGTVSYVTLINRFNSSFWVERQWFFGYNIFRGKFLKSVILYSTNPYR